MATSPTNPSDPPARDFRADPEPISKPGRDDSADDTATPPHGRDGAGSTAEDGKDGRTKDKHDKHDKHDKDKTAEPAAGQQPNPLQRTRTSGAWIGLALLAIALVLVIIFIAQNTSSQPVEFLGWSGSAPVAVSLLAAFVAGLLIAAVAGTLRIMQLRRRVKTLDKKLH